MAVSLEVRAIHTAPDVKDVIVTSAHLPEHADANLRRFVSGTLGVPHSFIVERGDLNTFWTSLPDHIQTDFVRADRQWLESDHAFLDQAIRAQLLGSFQFGSPTIGHDFKGAFIPYDPISRVAEWQYRNLRREDNNETQFGIGTAQLYATMLMHLDGSLIGAREIERTAAARASLQSYEIPLSQSPGLEGITLKDLAQKGIQAVCLFPLVAGVYAGVQHLAPNECGVAMSLSAAGGGMTVVAFSTLWIADKIFANIKHLVPSEGKQTSRRGK